jgi:LPXTG-motif cell wall-anchored protein
MSNYNNDDQNHNISQFGGATTDFFFKGYRKWIFITVMVLLLGGIGFYIYKRRKNRFGKRH